MGVMQLEVHMSPWQYRDGYATRIGELLGDGEFVGCPGRWRVHRSLAAVETGLRRVTFELEALDDEARAQLPREVL